GRPAKITSARNRTRPTVAQNVASMILAPYSLDRSGDGGLVRSRADELLHDGGSRILGNLADVAHRLVLDQGDAGLCAGELGLKLGLDLLALCLGVGLGSVTCLLADGIRLGLGIGKFLLVGSNRGVRFGLHARSFFKKIGRA